MGSCEKVLRNVEVYLDGELKQPQVAALLDHLKDCPECLEHEIFVSRLRAIIRRKLRTGSAVPTNLVDRIRHTIGGPSTF